MAPRLTLLDGSIGHLLKQQNILSQSDDFLHVALTPAGLDAAAAAARAYASAGCTVLTAPNFGVIPAKLQKAGRKDEELEGLTAACVAAVKAAASASPTVQVAASTSPTVWVAGCLPPLGPDCYAPAPAAIAQRARDTQARIAGVLLESGIDLFIAETCSCTDDAAALLAGAADAVSNSGRATTEPIPLWIAWTLADGVWPPRLRGGELLADAAVAAGLASKRFPAISVTAQLVNCSEPATTTAGVRVLRTALPPEVEVGAYANGFGTTTSEWLQGKASGGRGCAQQPSSSSYDADGMITPAAYAALAVEWIDLGATIVGGCCGVGPAHLAAVAEAVKSL